MCGRMPPPGDLELTEDDLAEIDAAHKPPSRKQALDLL